MEYVATLYYAMILGGLAYIVVSVANIRRDVETLKMRASVDVEHRHVMIGKIERISDGVRTLTLDLAEAERKRKRL